MSLERDDDMCVECGHERYEHRNQRCFAEHFDGTDCECDNADYVVEAEP